MLFVKKEAVGYGRVSTVGEKFGERGVSNSPSLLLSGGLREINCPAAQTLIHDMTSEIRLGQWGLRRNTTVGLWALAESHENAYNKPMIDRA